MRAILAGAFALWAGVAAAADIKVKIDNFTFTPETVTVHVGDTVVWDNEDDIPHTVTEKDKMFRSAALDTGDVFSFTFKTPGEVTYFCSLHAHMVGKVIVTP